MMYIVKTDTSLFCKDKTEGCEYMNSNGEYEVWRDPEYKEYVEENGEHFNEKLSEHASMMLKNADGTNHYWTKKEVLESLKSLGKLIPKWMSECDMHYVANMEYAQHFGLKDSVAKTEVDILKIACEEAWSPNSYEGEFFLHFITDIMKNGIYVDFEEMEM